MDQRMIPLYVVCLLASASLAFGHTYSQTQAEIDASVTPTDTSYPPGNVLRYGADPTGTSSSSTAFNETAAVVKEQGGGDVVIPNGTYLLSSQVTFEFPSTANTKGRIAIWGYGATLKTSGAISALRLIFGGNEGGWSVHGLTINQAGNSSATYGINIEQAWNCRLEDVTVIAGNGNASTYAAIRVANLTAGNDSTGSFWTRIKDCWIRKPGGANIPIGILLEGASNATEIHGVGINSCDVGVLLRGQSGNSTVPNAVVIGECAFENTTTAVSVVGTSSSNSLGPTVKFCRGENITTLFSITGFTSSGSQAPLLIGNNVLSGLTNYIYNPTGVIVNAFDHTTTPGLGQMSMSGSAGYRFRAISSGHALTTWASGANSGLAIQDNTGVTRGSFEYAISNRIRATSVNNNAFNLNGVRGISAVAGTDGNNLRGQKTFNSNDTATVTFATAEPNANYFVAISGNANETFWVTSKSSIGFTLRSSNGSSTATVDWIIVR